jgi:CheY-like chemotaxis protein
MSTYQNILLIEDDIDDQEFFLEVLHEVDPQINCVIAKNGPQGLRLLATLPPSNTIIFLDLNLPLMSGMQVLEIVKNDNRYKDIPVVVLTTSKHDSEGCTSLGASLYIVKPSSEDIFRIILTEILYHDLAADGELVENLLVAGNATVLRRPTR